MTKSGIFFDAIVPQAIQNLIQTAPNGLGDALRYVARLRQVSLGADPVGALVRHIARCEPNDLSLQELTIALQGWDYDVAPMWAAGTRPFTKERRQKVLSLLRIKRHLWPKINDTIRIPDDSQRPVVIAREHEPWYPPSIAELRSFYWQHYKAQLLPPRGRWTAEAVAALDASTNDVLSRLSSPTRPAIYQVKGLVVGHVQSGKTSHFNALISKAVDAGYRLIIVLAGTLDILRRQTQRRIDKDIVGTELLEPTGEYRTDAEWDRFVSHGGRPKDRGFVDWERLTTLADDYATLKHLRVLEFEPEDKSKPLNAPENLRTIDARLAVIKKVPRRITKLCDDLERLKKLRAVLEHVPTLIIDDESDQASINTLDPRKTGNHGRRPPTNAAIRRLLRLLPRSQYVGYTATPFANVFIDPNDAEDLFPKDFIVSLARPEGYMGVADFFDFDKEFVSGDYRSNRNAYVRDVVGPDESEDNLPKAVDLFVLSGAIKLYRESIDRARYSFRHHTMLVHHSQKTQVHEEDRAKVSAVFSDGQRYQRSIGLKRLKKLFEEDIRPVTSVRAPEAPMPRSFDQLKPYINRCIAKICETGLPVRIVNGEGQFREEIPDFEQSPVWGIIVGGTKLSRGYTVEGLTVSYYRRSTGTGDTLLQMGRWFGFRDGYRDLVRLFIGVAEPRGKRVVNLYEAFKAVCLDEEALRGELLMFSRAGGLRPHQVPPLVRQHLPWLPPAARNKMFNAEIKSRDFAGDWTEKTSAPVHEKAISGNLVAANELLKSSRLCEKVERVTFQAEGGERRAFDVLWGKARAPDVLAFLKSYRFAENKRPLYYEEAYIEGQIEKGMLKHWTILVPQPSRTEAAPVRFGGGRSLKTIVRSRVGELRFGAYSEPRHREAAAFLAGVVKLGRPSKSLASRRDEKSAVLVLYFVRERADTTGPVNVGFGIQYPGKKRGVGIIWGVKDETHPEEVLAPVAKSRSSPQRRARARPK